MIEKSRPGWIILCSTCSSQTATVREDEQYFCEQCFEGGGEEIEVDEEEDDLIMCDCGSEKCGLPHTNWCSTNEET